MKTSLKLLAPLLAAVAIAACNAGGSSSMPGTAGSSSVGQAVTLPYALQPEWQKKNLARAACPAVIGKPACMALIGTNGRISPLQEGFTPKAIEARYGLPITKGSGQIVAIVDAWDQPDAASDLAAYRTKFGLGTANFYKYNEDGDQGNYPSSCADESGGGWCVEEDLDIEMVSAACPNCTIYLIEASSAGSDDLETAEAEAVTLGAHIVSNSWSCLGSDACVDVSDFDTPGVVYLAANGDDGYGEIGAPAVLDSVVGVGGTTLTKTASGWSETVWDDSGAGCATGVAKPSWQTDPDCTGRTLGDVSAVACICVAEYDSNEGGWFEVGGTSVATPINAGVFALAGNAKKTDAPEHFWTLKTKKRDMYFNYISSGSDGSCGGEYLCTAGTEQFGEYSGPGGWGSPNGVKAY